MNSYTDFLTRTKLHKCHIIAVCHCDDIIDFKSAGRIPQYDSLNNVLHFYVNHPANLKNFSLTMASDLTE